ncbi:MAG: redoxin domain-containing protein [Flavobacteriaceae bacterium]
MKNHILKFFLGLALISSISYSQETASFKESNAVKVKNFSLKSTDGKVVNLTDYKGKFVVIHIATTWCPYCNAEAPYLEEIYKDYHDKNVEVLIIDVKEPKDLVHERIKNRFNLSFPVLLDTDGVVAASFAPKDVLPELARDEIMLASNLLLDPQGRIQFMSLLDTKNFDVKLIHLKKRLIELL